MTTDIKELVKRLREGNANRPWCHQAADALEALAGEVERLKGYLDEEERACEKAIITATAATAERDRLKAALAGMVHYAMHNEGWQDDHPEYLEAARKELGDAS